MSNIEAQRELVKLLGLEGLGVRSVRLHFEVNTPSTAFVELIVKDETVGEIGSLINKHYDLVEKT